MTLWFFCLLFRLFPTVGFPCSISIWWFLFYLILYFVLFSCWLLEAFFFPNESQKGSGSRGKELGGVEEDETIMRYIAWEKNLFSIKENKYKIKFSEATNFSFHLFIDIFHFLSSAYKYIWNINRTSLKYNK